MDHLSTHVLDVARGCPAEGIAVTLERADAVGGWLTVGHGVTDVDGRIAQLLPSGSTMPPGDYRLIFAVEGYLRRRQAPVFYPEVIVRVRITDSGGRFHLPLLLSPFGYSTYRGS